MAREILRLHGEIRTLRQEKREYRTTARIIMDALHAILRSIASPTGSDTVEFRIPNIRMGDVHDWDYRFLADDGGVLFQARRLDSQ